MQSFMHSSIHLIMVFCIHFFYHLSLTFQCNNPQTKEPKLKRATRIVEEWPELDGEIMNLQDKVAKEVTSHSNEKTVGKCSSLASSLNSIPFFQEFLWDDQETAWVI